MTTPVGIYNAADYGIVGDGVTDDAPALRSLVTTVPEGSIIFFPFEVVLLASTITHAGDQVALNITRRGIKLVGRGALYGTSYADLTGASRTELRFAPSVAGGVVVRWTADEGANVTDGSTSIYGGGMDGIWLAGRGNADIVLDLRAGVHDLTFDQCTFDNAVNYVIRGGVGTTEVGAHSWHSTWNIRFNGCEIANYTTHSVVLLSGNVNATAGEHCYQWFFNGCTMRATNGYVFDAQACDDIFVIGGTAIIAAGGTGRSVRLSALGGNQVASGFYVQGAYGFNDFQSVASTGASGAPSPYQNLMLGVGTIDVGDRTPSPGAGAHVWYIDDTGRENLRRHLGMSAYQYDDFMSGALTTGTIGDLSWFLSAGTAVKVDAVASHPGVRRISTGAGAGTLASLSTWATTERDMNSASSWILEYIFQLGQVDTDTMFRLGLADQFATDPPNAGIFIEKVYADTALFAVCRSGGVQTRTSLFTPSANTWYRLTIRRRGSSTIGFSIGDVVNNADTVLISTNVPGSLSPIAQIKNQAGTKTFDIDAYQFTINGLAR